MGEGIAYFHWRAWILRKFGPAYFDTEWGAQMTWQIQQYRRRTKKSLVVVNL